MIPISRGNPHKPPYGPLKASPKLKHIKETAEREDVSWFCGGLVPIFGKYGAYLVLLEISRRQASRLLRTLVEVKVAPLTASTLWLRASLMLRPFHDLK